MTSIFSYLAFLLFPISGRRTSSFHSPCSSILILIFSRALFHVFVYHRSTPVLIFLFFVSTYIFHVLITTYSSFILSTCPNHLSLASSHGTESDLLFTLNRNVDSALIIYISKARKTSRAWQIPRNHLYTPSLKV